MRKTIFNNKELKLMKEELIWVEKRSQILMNYFKKNNLEMVNLACYLDRITEGLYDTNSVLMKEFLDTFNDLAKIIEEKKEMRIKEKIIEDKIRGHIEEWEAEEDYMYEYQYIRKNADYLKELYREAIYYPNSIIFNNIYLVIIKEWKCLKNEPCTFTLLYLMTMLNPAFDFYPEIRKKFEELRA